MAVLCTTVQGVAMLGRDERHKVVQKRCVNDSSYNCEHVIFHFGGPLIRTRELTSVSCG